VLKPLADCLVSGFFVAKNILGALILNEFQKKSRKSHNKT